MTYRYIIILLLLNSSFLLYGQEEYLYVKGQVKNQESNSSIENVHVKVNQRNIIGKTNSKGFYFIKIPRKKNAVLVFSHTSFETKFEPAYSEKDTLLLNVYLKTKIAQIPEFEYKEGEPVIVFKSSQISIADYEFYQDKFLFLVYGKRLNKESEICLVDENENILSKHFVPGEPIELYNDYMGNVNLICKNAIYRIYIENDRLSIYELPMNDFNQLVKPIVDTMKTSVIFSDFLKQFPRFKYYAFDREDTTIKVVKEVIHKDMDWRYNFEYHFLSNADKQFAKRMAKKLKGYDKYDVAAHMTGFANSFLFDEIYAPLFVINDTINIFDHYEDKIWKFVDDTIQVDSIPFSYHKPAKKSSWKKELIMDELTGKLYGVFLKNGFYYLKQINHNTGEVVEEKKLHFQFAEKIKIKGGFVYYTYKPSQSLTKKFLYKEPF